MINGAKKRLLVVATTLALTASSAFAFTAPASATPPGNAADSRALPGALNDLSSQHDSGRDAPVGQVPAFSVSASQQMHGRVGGQALVDVNISRRKGDGVAASNLKVRLSGPSGFTVLSAAEFTPRHGTADATDWTCVPVNSNRDQDCTYTATSGNLASGVVPDPIRARIGIADNVSASTARIEAKATWTEDKVAPGSTGNAGDPVVGTRNQELTDGTDITVDGSLSVTLEGLTGDVVHVPATGGSDEDRTGHLVGKIGHINGRDASATWSQVSGPSVTFKRPTNVAQPADSTSQEYVVPAGTPDGTELVFGLDASSTGEHVSDTKTVTVRTHSPGTFDARTNLVAALAAATTQTPNSPKHGIKLRKADYKAAIAGKGVKHVTVTKKSAKKLKKLTLKFVHAAGVKSIKWKSIAGRAGILKKATKKKNAITIRVPKKKGTWLIRASVVLKNGHRISRTEVLKVDPIRPKVKVKKRALDLRVATADAASTQTFCNIGAGATLQFADGSSLTLPSSYQTPSPCTSTSKQSFTGATFSYNGTTFGSANGSLAGSTVKLSSVTFALPAKIASALPAGVPTSFTVSPPASTPVTATQSKGAWGAWTGTFSVPWLSFVPVPAGWSSPTGSLTLEPTTSGGKVTGAQLSLTQESAATDGSGGSVSFDLTLSTAGPSDVQVNAANIALFQTSGGDQIEFSGRGTFFLSKGQSNSITFTMNCSAPDAAGDCPLSSGFALSKNTSLTWTQGQGISLAGAQATVGSGANAYTFNLAGAYTGVGNWSLSVNNSGTPWAIGSTGVTLSNFTGAVSEKPSGSDSELSVDIGATVNNLAVGNELTVSSMTANVSNQCAEGVSGCTPGNVTVAIAVAAQANLFNDTIDFNATANLNLSTMQFEFDASETAIVDFGPAALNITSATLTLTNQTLTGSCQPAGGGSPPAGGVLSLGISATGTAYGQPIDIGGDVNGDGYCLWAALGDYSTGVFNGDNIVLAYSSYTGGADLTLPANAGDTNAASPDTNTMTVNVPAGAIELTGGFVIPADASASLGLPAGTSTFTAQADVNLSSFIADVDYQLSTPVFIGGGSSTGSTAVAISAIQLKIGLTSGPMQASLALIVDGDVVVASNNGDCGADSAGASGDCSYTPVDGSIGVTLGTGGLSVNISMGVNTSDGPVNNAFGQAGLDIDDLAISASAGVPGGIALAVNAAATLPSTWTSGVEIDNGAPVALAFNISDTSPCMMFSIGAEQDGTTALDIANAGVVTASYVNLVIAPDRCTIPTGGGSTKSVPAGYSFAFDGNVLGDATNVSLSVQFDPTIINATLDLQGFDLLGVVSMNTTTINLAMDSSNSSFSLGFSGGFGIGDPSIAGGVINVNGDVISTSPGNFTLVLGGGGNVNLVDVIDAGVASGSNNCPSWTAGLPQPPNNCLVAIQQRSGQVVNADISANLWFGLLGTNLSGDLDLVYSDGTLQDFHLGLGASISFWVGSVGGTAYIDYCQGTLNTNGGGTTDDQSCAIGGQGGSFRVFFNGSYSIGPCGDHWYDDECWTDGFSDTIVDTGFWNASASSMSAKALSKRKTPAHALDTTPPKLDVDFGLSAPGGKTTFGHPAASDYNLNLLWNRAHVLGWTGTANGTGGYDLNNSVMVSAVGPAAVQGAPACGNPSSGFSWEPSAGTHNPAPSSPAPVASSCGVEVVYATPGSNVVSEFGGSGTTIPENRFDDFAAWATTNSQQNALQSAGADWFNAPARGFAVCTPGGSGNSTCELRDANNVVVGTLISAAASSPATSKSGSNQAHVQLVNGLQTPIGSVPQGMRIASGSSVWSADGRYKLAVVDGVASLWDGAGSASYPDASGDGMASVWTAGTSHPGGYLELASSGVLNLRDTSGTSYWASGTPSPAVSGAPFLVVGGDYGLSVTDNSHLSSPLWHR